MNEHEARMAHPRMAAGALFFDEADRVLLVEPSYKDYRDIPGGYVERGESPLQACTREIHEELGIKPRIGRLLVVDWAPNPGEGDKVLYLFDGGRLSTDHRNQVALQANEIRGYDFHHAERLPELTIPRLVRRITAGIQARADGLTAYLEHGEPPQAGLDQAVLARTNARVRRLTSGLIRPRPGLFQKPHQHPLQRRSGPWQTTLNTSGDSWRAYSGWALSTRSPRHRPPSEPIRP